MSQNKLVFEDHLRDILGENNKIKSNLQLHLNLNYVKFSIIILFYIMLCSSMCTQVPKHYTLVLELAYSFPNLPF